MARLNLLSNGAHLHLFDREVHWCSLNKVRPISWSWSHACLFGFLEKVLIGGYYHLHIFSFSGKPNEFKDNTSFWKLNLETLISLEREKLSKAPTITSITPYQFLFFCCYWKRTCSTVVTLQEQSIKTGTCQIR